MNIKTIGELSTMSSKELTDYLNILLYSKTSISHEHSNITICIDRTLFAQRELTDKVTK